MRLLSLVWAGVLLAPVLAAQSSNGYLFFAPGGVTCCGHTSGTLHFGAGGEGVFWKGIGAGVEIGALATTEAFADSVVGILSPNGYFHFPRAKTSRLDPFVTGGYSLMFRSGHANLMNVGGGANFWFRERLGLRLEVRDHFNTTGTIGHFWGIRLGVAFR